MKKKKIYPFWESFNQTLNKYIPAVNKIRKNKNSEDFFLQRIWKIKSTASGLNLSPLNELAQVTTMEATKMNQKPRITN